MRDNLRLFLMGVFLSAMCFGTLFLFGCTTQQAKETTFYVSLSGNDNNPGTVKKPFSTFMKARDAVRSLKNAGPLPAGGITVYIRGGIYSIFETFKLNEQDSGTGSSPVIWRAYPGEKVQFLGGKVITGFEPVKNVEALKRIGKANHDKIMQTDLKAQGITNYGEIISPGRTRSNLGMELFFKGSPMTIARYPNEDWVRIADVPQTGEKLFDSHSKHYGKFVYDDDRLERWADRDDLWMYGYWALDWDDQFLKIEKIDTKKREIYPKEPHNGYGYSKGQRYFYLNMLEELDAPGEYILNRKTGMLYFWPPSPISESDALVSVFEDIMISLKEASHIKIQGIIFECSRGNAVTIDGGTGNLIAGCTMRNIATDAVHVNSGTNNGVISCDLYNVEQGIYINGGDRKTLTSAGNYANNNHVHHYSRINRTYRPGIRLLGVGNSMSHNYIHDAPHAGALFYGNEFLFEFNEITRIALETGDVGAFYTSHDWTYRGNIIRHNYFHHIHGPGHGAARIIYLDLPVGGTLVYGNIFYDTDMGFFTNSGRDITIENNIFVKCDPSIRFNVWQQPWMFQEGGAWRIWERLQEVNYKKPPYSTKYPELLNIFNDGDPAMPRGNKIMHNISYGGKWLELHKILDLTIIKVEYNLIADPVIFIGSRGYKKDVTEYIYGDTKMMEEFAQYNNMVIDADPGFVDVENENFNLKEDSPAWKLGFKRIPIEKIGLYIDEYRTSLPEK